MPTNYVEDYEQVTGKEIPTGDGPVVGVKVIATPVAVAPVAKSVAEVK